MGLFLHHDAPARDVIAIFSWLSKKSNSADTTSSSSLDSLALCAARAPVAMSPIRFSRSVASRAWSSSS